MAALAAGVTITAAAKAAGVGERTLRRWLQRPEMQAELRATEEQTKTDLMERLLGHLGPSAERAVNRLDKLVDSKNPWLALNAARAVLEQFTRIQQQVELSERIAALEMAVGARRNNLPVVNPPQPRTAESETQ